MLKSDVTILQADHRVGKNSEGREYSGYQVWMNIEGYQFPYKDWISDRVLNGTQLKKGMSGIIYLEQDNNLKPRIGYRFG